MGKMTLFHIKSKQFFFKWKEKLNSQLGKNSCERCDRHKLNILNMESTYTTVN